MKCPHCTVEIHESFEFTYLKRGNPFGMADGAPAMWRADHMACPACSRAIIRLTRGVEIDRDFLESATALVYPRGASRPPAPAEVPPHLAEDFNEAALVLDDSPKASAALSRRCLQSLLRDKGYLEHDLAKQIDTVLSKQVLPAVLAENLDAVRNIGNFAAHPLKDTNSGAVLPVEPHEAEWNLEVLEGLFDYFYVQPAKAAARRAALNAKLTQAGKPPMSPCHACVARLL